MVPLGRCVRYPCGFSVNSQLDLCISTFLFPSEYETKTQTCNDVEGFLIGCFFNSNAGSLNVLNLVTYLQGKMKKGKLKKWKKY